MMVYHNTLLGPNQKSPAEILHGNKAHIDLHVANAALQAKGLVEETLISRKNEHKADENQLPEGQTVMYKTPPEKEPREKLQLLNTLDISLTTSSQRMVVHTTAHGNTSSHTCQNILQITRDYLTHQHNSPGLQGPRGPCECLTEWTCKLTDENKVNFGTVELGMTNGL